MEFQPGQTVGIDLGTTFSTLAYLTKEGEPTPVENEDGSFETPSLILLAESGHVIVGPNRMRAALEDPANVVDRIKRHMGEQEYKRTFDGNEITPEFLSALILKKLRQDTQKQLGKIGNAVITVPYYFNDVRRKATQDAGRIAGLNVVDIINEPTAATLTYAWMRGELGRTDGDDKPSQILVYDLGGGTFDVTVVRYTPAHFQVLATDGDVELGGIDWSDRIVDYVAEEFHNRHGDNVHDSDAAIQLLRYECDQAKIRLSDAESTKVSCRHNGKSIEVEISRDRFLQMTEDLLQRTIDTTELVLEQAGITKSEIDAVVLVGGSTLMPVVGETLERVIGKAPYRDLSPFTAVAQGAAIHAAILEAKFRKDDANQTERLKKMLARVRQENVNSHGLGIEVRDRKTKKRANYVMIPRNTKLPAEMRHTFVTNYDDQRRVNIQVMQGEAPDPDACALIGNCRISDLAANLNVGSPIEVIYSFDESGRVHIKAIDQTGGGTATVTIERAAGLDDDNIETLAKLASEYTVE